MTCLLNLIWKKCTKSLKKSCWYSNTCHVTFTHLGLILSLIIKKPISALFSKVVYSLFNDQGYASLISQQSCEENCNIEISDMKYNKYFFSCF